MVTSVLVAGEVIFGVTAFAVVGGGSIGACGRGVVGAIVALCCRCWLNLQVQVSVVWRPWLLQALFFSVLFNGYLACAVLSPVARS